MKKKQKRIHMKNVEPVGQQLCIDLLIVVIEKIESIDASKVLNNVKKTLFIS